MKWRDDLFRITKALNVPGIDVVSKDPSEWELAADVDAVIVKAKLDSVFGEFTVSGREMRSLDRGNHAAVADVLRQKTIELRNKLHGQVLVDILNGEWSAPPSDEATLQRMERASLRLMAYVDNARKKGAV